MPIAHCTHVYISLMCIYILCGQIQRLTSVYVFSQTQSLKKYFSESEFQLMPPYPFKFSPPVICDDKWGVRASQDGLEPELEIRFPRELPESGWRLILQSERKVISYEPSNILFHYTRYVYIVGYQLI